MQINHSSKRKYHPLIILMYSSGMLDHLQLKDIPRNTRWRWDHFDHTNYYGYELAEDYIYKFDQIKEIYSSKYGYKAARFICSISNGYKEIVAQFEQQKSILRKNALQIVNSIERMKYNSGMNVNKICRLMGVSRDWYYRHRSKLECSKSLNGQCFIQNTNQLSIDEITILENLLIKEEHQSINKISTYFKAMNDGVIGFGISTFYKYCNLLGFSSRKKRKAKSRKIGFKATRVFEWLHVDITNIPTLEDGMQKVAFVKDNFSGALLHWKSINGKAGSEFITDLFCETFEKFKLYDAKLPINILSDGGSENKGVFLEWIGSIKAPLVVRKITARSDDFQFSNSMSEYTHRVYKTEFMKGAISQTIPIHLTNLSCFFQEYNYNRYPAALIGYTPMDIVNGKKPDKNRYKEQIKEGGIERQEKNRDFKFCIPTIGCRK